MKKIIALILLTSVIITVIGCATEPAAPTTTIDPSSAAEPAPEPEAIENLDEDMDVTIDEDVI